MNTMTYKGYAARIDYSDDDGCFVGHIAGINDVVVFTANRSQSCAQLLKKQLMIISKLAKSSIAPLKSLILAILCCAFLQRFTRPLPWRPKLVASVSTDGRLIRLPIF